MRKAALSTIFILFAFCLSFAQGGLRIMESLVMPSRILNQDVKFSVCLPGEYYNETRSYPVVYLLHGLGDDETAWLEYGRISQYADQATEKDEVVPMIFIMPEGYTNYYVNDYKGSFLYQDMFINELVPYIDSMFRTISDRQHRGLMGYSMGGFGALVLHLKHPDVFGSAVPLSISVRTDEQYKVEYAPEWDEQWGRLFGAQGITGDGRITEYYRQNSPFHIIAALSPEEMKSFNVYIDNGDKEQTLCRSNEELHILMHKEGFPHQYRVREGGHSFEYWCSALPNALRFLSDAFEAKPYRGDIKEDAKWPPLPEQQLIKLGVGTEDVIAYIPEEYAITDRLYPALYFAGEFSLSEKISISARVNQAIDLNEISPMLVLFIPEKLLNQFTTILPEIEEKLRIRKGYRFRALAGYQGTADKVCEIAMNREQFSSCLLVDAYIQKENISGMLSAMKPDALKRTPFFITAPDNGLYAEGNGNLHMIMRDMELKHEYRIKEGDGGFDLIIGNLEEMILFIATNFHR